MRLSTCVSLRPLSSNMGVMKISFCRRRDVATDSGLQILALIIRSSPRFSSLMREREKLDAVDFCQVCFVGKLTMAVEPEAGGKTTLRVPGLASQKSPSLPQCPGVDRTQGGTSVKISAVLVLGVPFVAQGAQGVLKPVESICHWKPKKQWNLGHGAGLPNIGWRLAPSAKSSRPFALRLSAQHGNDPFQTDSDGPQGRHRSKLPVVSYPEAEDFGFVYAPESKQP